MTAIPAAPPTPAATAPTRRGREVVPNPGVGTVEG